MIKSMTGFGKSVCELPAKRITIEIKSLNSKQLDINTRIPNLYREKELIMRNIISQTLQRGKVDVTFYVESMVPDKIPQVNEEVISAYHSQLKGVAEKLNIGDSTDYLRIIMPLPDTMKTMPAELDEEEWKAVSSALVEAIEQLDNFRTQEGDSMQMDVRERCTNIAALLEQVAPFETQRTEKIKNRIKENLSDFSSNGTDENRFEQELIYYLEKLDISEEKVRLKNHINYFNETMEENGPVGKKLGFITQEMGREINTLGSKANDSDIQHIVVKMKDDLEKIKEQILNIL
ncbi:YicC/YloC family endoribonuclease [Marinilabilia salmonicolor]|uniref:YicC/YloC family endoribonuclease n=1 Tax=Marinilabilia salmonicolor TaxID=989 RepID=UPI00030EA253|nr:YicC/YloC family endoribonuclease [Marinilabilia salmonicolor]